MVLNVKTVEKYSWHNLQLKFQEKNFSVKNRYEKRKKFTALGFSRSKKKFLTIKKFYLKFVI